MSSKLVYNPLNREADEFRLLTILPDADDELQVRCTLKTYSLSQPPPYHALSYVWGDPGVTTEIIINDAPFQATSNLECALRAIRFRLKNEQREMSGIGRNDEAEAARAATELQLSTSTEYRIWVDAACINQADLNERENQVLRMRDIYTKSVATIAWLGLEGDHSDDAFSLIHLLYNRAPKQLYDEVMEIEAENKHKNLWVALAKLLERNYWKRCWVLQEIALAKEVWFLCGQASANFKCVLGALFGAQFQHEVRLERFGYPNTADSLSMSNMLRLCMKLDLKKRRRALDPADVADFQEKRDPKDSQFTILDVTPDVSLAYLLVEKSVSRLQSTHLNDQIFSLLGLASDSASLVPNPRYELPFRTVMKDVYQSIIDNTKILDFIRLSSGNEPIDPRVFSSTHPTQNATVTRKENELERRRRVAHYEEIQRERAAGLWPSWVPDNCKTFVTTAAFLETQVSNTDTQFHVTHGQHPEIRFNGAILVCRGIIFDAILLPTENPAPTVSWASRTASTVYSPSNDQCPNPYMTPAETYDAIWKSTVYVIGTYVGEASTSDVAWAFAEFWHNKWSGAPDDDREHSYLPISAFDSESLDPETSSRRWGLLHNQKDLMVHGLPLKEWVRRRTWDWSFSTERSALRCEDQAGVQEIVDHHGHLGNEDSVIGRTIAFLSTPIAGILGNMMARMISRVRETPTWVRPVNSSTELFVTAKGYIGSRFKYLSKRKGDKIALLFGCSVPVILRPRDNGDGYDFIGEAYVHGIMRGEVFQGCNDHEAQWISIH